MKTAQELGITQQQFNNLFKLAYYLLEGKLKAAFDMSDYCARGHTHMSVECGSVGCAIGHGPYAGIEKFPLEDWDEYSSRAFIDGFNIGPIWGWLFDYEWSAKDNTPQGAAKRILYFLKYGKPKDLYDFNPKLYSGMRLVRKSHSTH